MELFFQNHQKTTPFWILSDKLGCSFFPMNIQKLHLISSLKITLKVTFWTCPFQKTTPQFVTQNNAENLPQNTPLCPFKSHKISYFVSFHSKNAPSTKISLFLLFHFQKRSIYTALSNHTKYPISYHFTPKNTPFLRIEVSNVIFRENGIFSVILDVELRCSFLERTW